MKEKNEVQAKWTKAQIVKAKKYAHMVDVVSAVLDDDKSYTIAEVDARVAKFLKGGTN